MAKYKKASKSVLKWKKKKWYDIIAPSYFNNKELGRTVAAEPEMLSGRQMSTNLMLLTRDPKKQNIQVNFEITNVTGNKCDTRICRYEILSNSLRKYVRREKSKVDNSFLATSKDGIRVRIKPLIVTQFTSSKPVQSAVRQTAKDWITQKVGSSQYDDVMQEIILGKFQKEMKDAIKTITSIKTSEIRVIAIEEGKKQFSFEEEATNVAEA